LEEFFNIFMNPSEGERVQGLNEKCDFIDLDKYRCVFIEDLRLRPTLDKTCNCASCRSALLEMRRRRFYRVTENGF
jgi:hypothetical protein